jgi:rhamnogalacturonan hydrolase
MASKRFSLLALLSLCFSVVFAQLSGSVGPTTSLSSKASKKICNVLNYGAKADQSTDLGPPLASAWNDCKNGGIGKEVKYLKSYLTL